MKREDYYKPDLTELDKLESWLKENGIPYERIDKDGEHIELVGCRINDRHQLVIPHHGKGYKWDAVCHYGSYGCKEGLLEIYGALCKDNQMNPIGWLTAEDVISLASKYHGKGGE